MAWDEYDVAVGTIATMAGLLVVVPMLVSTRTRRWGQRMLDGDIESIGIAALLLAIIGIAIYNRLS